MGKPSVMPPTVFRRGDVMPPTMGRPFVVSSTVFRSLRASVLCISKTDGLAYPPRSPPPPPPFPLLFPPPPPRSPAILIFVEEMSKVAKMSRKAKFLQEVKMNVPPLQPQFRRSQYMFRKNDENLFLVLWLSVTSERILPDR
jgi:hypothetical protein